MSVSIDAGTDEEKTLYTLEDIRRAIDFDKFNYEYGNAVGLKSEEETEDFIKSLKT